jgi:Xaa-Pro aminopeptidase
MNPAKRKLNRLRAVMKEQGIDGYIVPNTDPHLGEYIPDHWKTVQWLTGFTGSAATVLVTRTFAGLWTDSRYFIQAEKQLAGSGFALMRLNNPPDPSVNEWLKLNFKKGGILGFDGRLLSITAFRNMKRDIESKLPVFVTDADLISDLWDNRPGLGGSVAYEHTADFSGADSVSKIGKVREMMLWRDADYHLLTSPDDIMWLLNLRAGDVHYSPLLLSFALVSGSQVLLFADEKKIPPKLAGDFDQKGIVVLPYEEVMAILSSIPEFSSLLISPSTTTVSIFNAIGGKVKFIEDISIPARLKAVKNATEIKNIRNAMVKDGVALTRFFFWLEESLDREKITEASAAARLRELRLQQTNCTGESFGSIIAYNDHAALPHYSYEWEKETTLRKNGILLVDSGGQYLDGTTDVTRSVALGKPSIGQKTDFTLALKGMISLAMARFPAGTKGYQLDILARKALWDSGLNYGHGTGHGVGFFLNVHEGPPAISPSGGKLQNEPLVPGMVISDEPGIYREGQYGFRTENLVHVTEDIKTAFGQFLKFETLTLCYIDPSLTDKSLLSAEEIIWLNEYHKSVYEKLSPFLKEDERKFLRAKTKDI